MNPVTLDDPRLTALVLGELSEQEQASVEQAVAADTELAREVAEIRETVSLFAPLEGSKLTLDPARREEIFSEGKAAEPEILQLNQARANRWQGMRVLVGGIAAAVVFYTGLTQLQKAQKGRTESVAAGLEKSERIQVLSRAVEVSPSDGFAVIPLAFDATKPDLAAVEIEILGDLSLLADGKPVPKVRRVNWLQLASESTKADLANGSLNVAVELHPEGEKTLLALMVENTGEEAFNALASLELDGGIVDKAELIGAEKVILSSTKTGAGSVAAGERRVFALELDLKVSASPGALDLEVVQADGALQVFRLELPGFAGSTEGKSAWFNQVALLARCHQPLPDAALRRDLEHAFQASEIDSEWQKVLEVALLSTQAKELRAKQSGLQ